MKILILGATGGTGRLIVRDALEKGHSVVALVRSKARASELSGADIIEGDVCDEGHPHERLERLRCRRHLIGHWLEPVPRGQPADRRDTRPDHGDDAQRRAPSGLRQCPGGWGQPWPRRLRVRPTVPAFAAQPCLQGQRPSGSRDPRQLTRLGHRPARQADQ